MNSNSDIRFRAGATLGARYLSGRTTFDEQFIDGRLVTRYWSPSGQIWPEMHLANLHYRPDQPADTFTLSINGQRLEGGYEWVGAAILPDPSSYRSHGRDIKHGAITLVHRATGVQVVVHTRLDGGPFIVRWIEITNTTDRALGISAVAPFSGSLWSHRSSEHIPEADQSPFELAFAHQFHWGQEGDFWYEPLSQGVRVVDGGKLGRSGWGRPAFWAHNRANGQTFVCELAWGGNYEFALDHRISSSYNPQMHQTSLLNELYFHMGLSGHDPVLRILEPGDVVNTPAVHLGIFQADSDAIVQATHDHVRNVIMPERVPGRYVEIEANHRGYLCDRENEPDLKRDVEVARSIGTELYVIDAGWYGKEPNIWWKNVGDWHAGSWLPNGLEPVAQHAQAQGMKFGLWVEIEAVGESSALRGLHPEWLLSRDDHPIANARALDLTKPEVAAWIEQEIDRLIAQYRLDMYRIDHNHTLTPSGNRRIHGMVEDLTWRYYDALYGVFERLHAKYPDVVFQNCAGGGGRLDWGTLHLFNNTELSDWMRLPRGLKILNGVTMSLPPEVLLRTFGTEVPEIDLEGDVDAQLRLVCLCRPIFRGIAPSLEEFSPFLRDRIDHHLNLYRETIRPIMVDGMVYHHTPFLKHTELSPWCVLEYGTAGRDKAVIGLFRTGCNGESVFHLRPRGINPAYDYTIVYDNSSTKVRMSGAELMLHGLSIRLEQPQSSEMLLIQQVI